MFPLAYAYGGDSIEAVRQCRKEPVAGFCRASFPRYYYDAHDRRCKRFIYGGCGGNNNRFLWKEECENHCRGVLRLVIQVPEGCEVIYYKDDDYCPWHYIDCPNATPRTECPLLEKPSDCVLKKYRDDSGCDHFITVCD